MKRFVFAALLIASSSTCLAQSVSGLCMLSPTQHAGKTPTVRIVLSANDCDKGAENCMEMSDSESNWSRWSGVSAQSFESEASPLSARLSGDAGGVVCDGVVHDGALSGRFRFIPSSTFPHSMEELGFSGITPWRQLSFLMLDVTLAWTRNIKAAGVTGLSAGQLISLRALQIDPDYIRALAAAGYPELRAGKLIEMKAVGVTPEKAREARAMGLQPNQEELIQMSVFKIDKAFVERMRARGVQELTVAKLIKIKTFKLDE